MHFKEGNNLTWTTLKRKDKKETQQVSTVNELLPREDFPAVVSPRNSRCLVRLEHIQLILGSLVIAL